MATSTPWGSRQVVEESAEGELAPAPRCQAKASRPSFRSSWALAPLAHLHQGPKIALPAPTALLTLVYALLIALSRACRVVRTSEEDFHKVRRPRADNKGRNPGEK